MERVFTELHDAYANLTQEQKGCKICLVTIKNVRTIIDSELSLRKILE